MIYKVAKLLLYHQVIQLNLATHPFSFRFFPHVITEYWVDFFVLYRGSPLVTHSIYLTVCGPIPNP